MSDQESLSLHAEVLALQKTLGLSYKDAVHRLYMSEVEKMKAEKQSGHSFAKIRKTIDNMIINEIYPPLSKIDSGDLDGVEYKKIVDMLLLILQCSHLKPGTFIFSAAYYIGRSVAFHVLMVTFEI